VVVGILALCVSIADHRRARSHQRLSVRPLLRFDCHADAGADVRLCLHNVGFGPAVVTNLGVGYCKPPVFPADGESQDTPWHAVLAERHCALERWEMYLPESGEAIACGESMELLKFCDSGQEPRRREAVSFIQDGLSLEVKYQSIYGEEFVALGGHRKDEGGGAAA